MPSKRIFDRRDGFGLGLRCAASMVAVILSGCILTPPLQEISEGSNQAPDIVTSTVSPSVTSLPIRIPLQAECIPEFSAVVTDVDGGRDLIDTDDIEHLVYLRYFIDYAVRPKDQQPVGSDVLELDPSDAFRATYSFTPPFDFFVDGGSHTIELLVADNVFLGFSSAEPDRFRQAAPFEVGEPYAGEPGQIDSFVWTIIFDDSAPCSAEGEGS